MQAEQVESGSALDATECTKGQRFARTVGSDRGAVGTEMAIIVAIVVAIALALGAVLVNTANNRIACIPQNPGDPIPAGC